MAIAEFLREADRFAIRPRARIALPVFWISRREASSNGRRVNGAKRVRRSGVTTHLPLSPDDELLELVGADLVVAEVVVVALTQPLGLQALLGGQALLLAVNQELRDEVLGLLRTENQDKITRLKMEVYRNTYTQSKASSSKS